MASDFLADTSRKRTREELKAIKSQFQELCESSGDGENTLKEVLDGKIPLEEWKKFRAAFKAAEEHVKEVQCLIENDPEHCRKGWIKHLERSREYMKDPAKFDVEVIMKSLKELPNVVTGVSSDRLGTCTLSFIEFESDGKNVTLEKRNYNFKHAHGDWEIQVDEEEVSWPDEDKEKLEPWEQLVLLLNLHDDLEDGELQFGEEEGDD